MKQKLIVLLFIINALLIWAVFSPGKNPKAIPPPITPTPIQIPLPTPINLSSDKLSQLVNDWRAQNGYQPYIKSDFDCNFALERIPEIEQNFSHNGFHLRIKEAPVGATLGENLAMGYESEQITLTAWLNSPEHLANLKAPYDHSCIQTDGAYAVEIFSYF